MFDLRMVQINSSHISHKQNLTTWNDFPYIIRCKHSEENDSSCCNTHHLFTTQQLQLQHQPHTQNLFPISSILFVGQSMAQYVPYILPSAHRHVDMLEDSPSQGPAIGYRRASHSQWMHA